MSQKLFHRLAINMIHQVGPNKTKQLIETFGTAEDVFSATRKELLAVDGINNKLADEVLNKSSFTAAEREVKFIQKNKVTVIYYQDENYPERLRAHPASPALLFYKGKADLEHHRTVGIVGTRKTSAYGHDICKKIVQELRKYDVQIISGLANGVDSIAHRSSLDADIPTIGVLGHGLQMVYPYNNQGLAEDMQKNGGILTEYTSDQGPDREHFPMRNKIVAALCDTILVVESAAKGGSLITARFAKQYHKKVFAIPGRINDPVSAGCNLLIKNNQASLAESADDIAKVMSWSSQTKLANIQTKLFIELDDREKKVIGVIKKLEKPSLDRICYETKILNSEMASLLLNLEFKGVIKSLPGKRFIQTA